MSIPKVECSRHGEQDGVYACHHLAAALHDRQPRGLNRVEDEDGTQTVWCDSCEAALEKAGGDWTDAVQDEAKINMICVECFADLKSFDTVKELE